MRFFKKIIAVILLFSTLLLGGCWDSRDIQDLIYIIGLGFDFDGKGYIVYAQALDFTNVAKQESSKVASPPQIWVGKGKGHTVNDAFNDLYNSTQSRIFWGHATALLFSERLLKKGITEVDEAFDMINRFRELRYNIWMYGTDEPIEKILTIAPMFNLSPLSSILHEPSDIYRQKSVIPPVYFYEAIRSYREPGRTAYVPVLALSSSRWSKNEKPHRLLQIKGAYFNYNRTFRGFISYGNLYGFQWLNRKTVRAPITIYNGQKKPIASLVLTKPKYKITPSVIDGKAYFDVKLVVHANINELIDNISEKKLQKQAEMIVTSEIRKVFQNGLKIKADVFNFGDVLYKKAPHKWKEVKKRNPLVVDKDSLRSLKVFVHLSYSGKYKLRTQPEYHPPVPITR